MTTKSVINYGYMKIHALDKPLPFFPQICIDDIVCILEKCRKEKDRVNALWMHLYVHSYGMEGHSFLGNHLVSMLVEIEYIDNARQVFDKLEYRNNLSWNSLIIGYIKCGNPQYAIIVYERMQEDPNVCPNEHTFVAVLKACSKIKDLQTGVKVHEELDTTGLLRINVFIGGALVDMYAKCGQLSKAKMVFDLLPVQNVVSWTALISGYVDHGHADRALLYLEQMHLEGVHPNIVTLVCLLRACGMIQALEKGRDLHREIERQGLLERELVGNTLVDMYAKCGALTLAKQAFDNIRIRDVVSWTALIIGYAEYGQGEKALEYFDQMQAEGVSPNAITFIASLKACGGIKATSKGRDIHAEIVRQGLLERNLVLANTLIDMYAKCGCLTIAHQVFEKLYVRDVVSWTSLIAGYYEYGYNGEALSFFEQMHYEGIVPNVVTLVCCLKVCGNIKALDKGKIIHMEIEKQGWLERDIVGYSLVDMYSKCGLMTMAQQVFDKLPIRNIELWNALITGYAESGHDETALECVEKMQYEGVYPDSSTYASSLKVCGKTGAGIKGQDIHAEIERRKLLEGDIIVGNSLLDFYVKFGLISTAKEVFERLPIHDVISWTTLIMGYVEYGHCEEALQLFEQMRLENVLPNAATFVAILKASSNTKYVSKGKEIHSEIIRQKLLEENVALGNMLVDFYARCGFFAIAQQIHNELPERDVVSWTALILGYAEHGHGEKALKCFEEMELEGVTADPITLLCSLKACGSIGATERVQEIHAEIKKWGVLERNLVIGSTLVDIYAKCGSLDLAQEVFDSVPVRDVVLWTTLIAGYAEHGYGEKALRSFEQMQLECVSPNAETFIYGLKACGSIGDVNWGQEMHADIERQGFLENVFVGSSLVDMYAKCGLLAMAQQVFDKLSVRNTVLWTALIAAYADYGDGHDALKCLDKMQLEGFSPNYVTFICSLKACGNVGAAEKGQDIHLEMERQGLLEGDYVIGNALVDMYAKCSCLAKANDVFNKLPLRSVVSWTALMAGYAQCGEGDNVFHILDRMVEDGIKPNPVTFLIVLRVCNRAGLFDKSQMYLEAMSKDYGIVPNVKHLTWVIDLLCRSGQFNEAILMIKKIPSVPNLVVWHTLLDACRSSGNVKIGKEAFDHAVTLDGGDASAYVLISHIYASSEFQKETFDVIPIQNTQ